MKNILLPFAIIMVAIIVIFLVSGSFETDTHSLLSGLEAKPVTFSIYSFLILTSDIVLPVPSSIVMYLNGFVLGIFAGSLLSFASLMASAVIGYFLGKIALRFRKKEPEEKANLLLSRIGSIAVIITRGIPVLSESVCIVCGYNRMPFKKYFLFIIIGTIPLCILYAYFGYTGKNENNFLPAFFCSLLVSAGFWFFGKKLFSPVLEA